MLSTSAYLSTYTLSFVSPIPLPLAEWYCVRVWDVEWTNIFSAVLPKQGSPARALFGAIPWALAARMSFTRLNPSSWCNKYPIHIPRKMSERMIPIAGEQKKRVVSSLYFFRLCGSHNPCLLSILTCFVDITVLFFWFWYWGFHYGPGHPYATSHVLSVVFLFILFAITVGWSPLAFGCATLLWWIMGFTRKWKSS